MNKGQYYSVFKLLQAAVFASIFLVIAWGTIQWLQDKSPGTDVATVSVEVLKSAYSARTNDPGKQEHFVMPAWLRAQFFTAEALRSRAGLPDGAVVKIVCDQGFCDPICPETAPCDGVTLERGNRLDICSSCKDVAGIECRVYIGESECLWW